MTPPQHYYIFICLIKLDYLFIHHFISLRSEKTFSYLYFHAITYYLTLSFIFFIYLFCTYLYDAVHCIEIKWRDSLGLAKIFRRMMIPHHIFIFLTKWLTSFLFLYIYKPCLLTYLGITCQLTILFFCSVHWFFLIIFQNACDRAHCINNAICQSGFTSKGYRCVCSFGFTGPHCEQGEIKMCTYTVSVFIYNKNNLWSIFQNQFV